MVDDTGAQQARVFLDALYEEVEKISCKLEIVEERGPTSARGVLNDHRLSGELRRKLYEAHRLIDGLHRRFPGTLRPTSDSGAGELQVV